MLCVYVCVICWHLWRRDLCLPFYQAAPGSSSVSGHCKPNRSIKSLQNIRKCKNQRNQLFIVWEYKTLLVLPYLHCIRQFFFFFFSRAVPSVYGGFQARGRIRAVAASLRQSHSNAGSIQAISATYTTAHGYDGSLTHWARPGIEPKTRQ